MIKYLLKVNHWDYLWDDAYFVTGFWRTDQNVTLGLFHFIAQLIAILILPMHSGITRLSYLVSFSQASFITNHIKSHLR